MRYLLAVLALCLFIVDLPAQTPVNNVRINQEGYYPFAKKIAVVTGDTKVTPFFVVAVAKNDTVYRGQLGELNASANSSLKTRIADFSKLTRPGKFKVFVPGVGESYSFTISAHVHSKVADAALKGFYYQRVSMPL